MSHLILSGGMSHLILSSGGISHLILSGGMSHLTLSRFRKGGGDNLKTTDIRTQKLILLT